MDPVFVITIIIVAFVLCIILNAKAKSSRGKNSSGGFIDTTSYGTDPLPLHGDHSEHDAGVGHQAAHGSMHGGTHGGGAGAHGGGYDGGSHSGGHDGGGAGGGGHH